MSKGYWILLAIILTIIAYGVIAPRYNVKKISDCSVETNAIVVSVTRLKGKIPTVKYEFSVGGQIYRGAKSVKGSEQLSELTKGSTVKIEYECKNPRNNLLK